MPEEINRILTDHLSDLLFVTEESGIENLRKEGIANEKINFAGNTMIDSLRTCEERASASEILKTLGLQERTNGNGSAHSIDPYVLLTLHRPANVDNPEAFLNILLGLQELTAKYPVIFPVHPRTRKRIQEFGFAESCGIRSTGPGERGLAPKGLTLTDPLGYLEFLCLMKHAALVVTDSGGIQEETTCLGVACVTVRENTERPITLTRGTNVLAGVCKEGIQHAIRQQWGRQFDKEAPPMWDGKASRRIVDTVIRAVDSKRSESHPVQVDVRR